jgi:membrane protein DedA with SNARE-associated domain
MEHFITAYGYWAVFLGSLVEGESVILTAGVLSSQGYLSLAKIMAVAFVGTLLADQTLFFVGYYGGDRILARFPKLNPASQKVFRLLRKHETSFILTFRFIYSIRTISPVIIGASGISFKQFAILNVISGAIWSVVSCGAGYLFGDYILNNLSPVQRFLVVGCIGFGFLGVVGYKLFHFFHKDEGADAGDATASKEQARGKTHP